MPNNMKKPLLSSLVLLFLLEEYSCLKKSGYLTMDGDVRLGAIFPIHKAGHANGTCGEIQREDGIQPLVALLYTLDEINANPKLLPGISLGVMAMDSCDNPFYAEKKALPLVQGFIRRETNMTWIGGDKSSPQHGGEPTSKWAHGDNIVGIVGPQTSPVSVKIASLGRLFGVPQVSYLATSVSLSDRAKYPHFFRTVPSDEYQAKAIVALLQEFNWKYASIVHSDSEYGETGYMALKEQVLIEGSVCLTDPFKIYNKIFKDADYINVIKKLLQNKRSRVVIVFADRLSAGRLLEAAKTLKVKNHFIWIGSDAWASRESVVQDREEVVNGAIAVQPLRMSMPGYNEYFTNLLKTKNDSNEYLTHLLKARNDSNLWFDEYFQRYHNCSSVASQSSSPCNQFKYNKQLYIHFVRDAVYAFAHALHNLHRDLCKTRGPCQLFKHKVFYNLKDYLHNVTFKDASGQNFTFYGHGKHDGPPRYSIIYFTKDNESNLFDWKNVGSFHYNNLSSLDPDFKAKMLSIPNITHCQRRPCNVSEVIVQNTKDHCCYHCRQCSAFEFKVSDYECQSCPLGHRSKDENRTECEPIPETYLDYKNNWAIGAIILASVGILCTFVTAIILWKFWNTPIVKACGRELSLLLLLGTFFSFTTTFAIVSKPTTLTCGIMRFCIGFCYTVCYAAVVTKTNRVSRIFNATTNPRFTSPISSLMIAGGLISVEVFINVIWIIVEPPSTKYIADLNKRILVCKGVNDSFMAGLIYPFFLIFFATLYAFKTRKCPGGFNETRFIFFANSITCIHWLAYVPLYLVSTDLEFRAVILAFSLSLSGIVQLACLLLPRVYTILFKPEKNTRGDVMTKHGTRFPAYKIPPTPPNSFAIGGHASDNYMTQWSTSSTLICSKAKSSYSMGNIPAVVSAEQQQQQQQQHLPLPQNAVQLNVKKKQDRQSTWSSNLDKSQPTEEDLVAMRRARSSSECKGTQTSDLKERKIKFKVSLSSQSPSIESIMKKDSQITEAECE